MRLAFKSILGGILMCSSTALAEEATVEDWLLRTDLSINVNEDRLTLHLETLQPFHHTEQSSVFFQGRAAGSFAWRNGDDEGFTLNGGFGARQFISDDTILGFNAFYDHQTKYDHQRVSLGAEIISNHVTARLNAYESLSGWKEISTVGTTVTEERALSGVDGELEWSIPYLPWARIAAGGYYWNAVANHDVRGFSAAFRGDINEYARVEIGGSIDNYDEKVWAKLSISLGAKRDVEYTAQNDLFSDEPLPQRNLSNQLLRKVERSNTIVTERRTRNTSTGATVSAGVFISGE
ncbi:MAG: inverse autotransporter beta domain-containing protein [Rhizobiaceae bacterium]